MTGIVDTRTILIFNNLYIKHNNFQNDRWEDGLKRPTSRDRLIHWLLSYD